MSQIFVLRWSKECRDGECEACPCACHEGGETP